MGKKKKKRKKRLQCRIRIWKDAWKTRHPSLQQAWEEEQRGLARLHFKANSIKQAKVISLEQKCPRQEALDQRNTLRKENTGNTLSRF